MLYDFQYQNNCDSIKKFKIDSKFDCSCEKVRFITEYIFSHFIQKSNIIGLLDLMYFICFLYKMTGINSGYYSKYDKIVKITCSLVIQRFGNICNHYRHDNEIKEQVIVIICTNMLSHQSKQSVRPIKL